MQTLLVDRGVSMSEFKKNPAAILRQAQGRPVAVLNHNRVDFYLLEPRLFEALLADLARKRDGSADPQGGTTPAQLIEDLLRQVQAAAD